MIRKGATGDAPAPIELSMFVVGIAHLNADGSNRTFAVAMCTPGEPVELRPEPRNEHDQNAVAVFSVRGEQLGYLAREKAEWIAGKLAVGQPIEAIFQEGGTTAAVIRVNLGGEPPTLPAPRPPKLPPAIAAGADPDSGFYPDEIPPDD